MSFSKSKGENAQIFDVLCHVEPSRGMIENLQGIEGALTMTSATEMFIWQSKIDRKYEHVLQ